MQRTLLLRSTFGLLLVAAIAAASPAPGPLGDNPGESTEIDDTWLNEGQNGGSLQQDQATPLLLQQDQATSIPLLLIPHARTRRGFGRKFSTFRNIIKRVRPSRLRRIRPSRLRGSSKLRRVLKPAGKLAGAVVLTAGGIALDAALGGPIRNLVMKDQPQVEYVDEEEYYLPEEVAKQTQ